MLCLYVTWYSEPVDFWVSDSGVVNAGFKNDLDV